MLKPEYPGDVKSIPWHWQRKINISLFSWRKGSKDIRYRNVKKQQKMHFVFYQINSVRQRFTLNKSPVCVSLQNIWTNGMRYSTWLHVIFYTAFKDYSHITHLSTQGLWHTRTNERRSHIPIIKTRCKFRKYRLCPVWDLTKSKQSNILEFKFQFYFISFLCWETMSPCCIVTLALFFPSEASTNGPNILFPQWIIPLWRQSSLIRDAFLMSYSGE